MSLNLEIIRAAEFIRVGAQGRFDLTASKKALATLARACRKRGIHHAVVDLRSVEPGPKPVFSQQDLLELVRTFPEVGFNQRRLRLALIYRSDPHKRARLFAFLSNLHGWKVQAFDGFERALIWLSREPQKTAPIRKGSRGPEIPIRFGGETPAKPRRVRGTDRV